MKTRWIFPMRNAPASPDLVHGGACACGPALPMPVLPMPVNGGALDAERQPAGGCRLIGGGDPLQHRRRGLRSWRALRLFVWPLEGLSVASILWGAAIACMAAGFAHAQASTGARRDRIYVEAASTVYPFSKAVAERLAGGAPARSPIVKSTSTTDGIKAFCAGGGEIYPDVVSVARRLSRREFESCQSNGVTDIVEIPVGLDGVTVVGSASGPSFRLTLAQLFLALAKEVPRKDGRLIPNPYRNWSDIDPSLPTTAIKVAGPPSGNGVRDSLHELFLQKGAESNPVLAQLKKRDNNLFQRLWKTIRTDGVYVESGEDFQQAALKALGDDKNVLGVISYSFFASNRQQLAAVPINGVEPTYETISQGRFEGGHKLYIYVKKARVGVVANLDKLAAEYVSERAFGANGYLLKLGVVPLGEADFFGTLAIAKNMPLLTSGVLRD